MSERLVRFVEDIVLEDGCTQHWNFEGGDKSGWYYCCTKHGFQFNLNEPCPGSILAAKAGEQMYLPQKVANRFVSAGQAVYPTHKPVVDEGVQATVNRVNTLMDSMGLSHLDAEAVRTMGVQGQKGGGHYAKPRDSRLARDLGIDPTDIADMRKLAGS